MDSGIDLADFQFDVELALRYLLGLGEIPIRARLFGIYSRLQYLRKARELLDIRNQAMLDLELARLEDEMKDLEQQGLERWEQQQQQALDRLNQQLDELQRQTDDQLAKSP